MSERLYKETIERFLRFKELMLLAEEIDPEGKVSLQPYMEMYRGIDHLIRVEAARLGVNDAPVDDPYYEEENLRKAKGHFYRAAFDVLDWLSLNLRDSIAAQIEPYNTETINAVAPEYYTEIKPMIIDLSGQIAEVRAQKDVGVEETIIELVQKYESIVLQLRDKLKAIIEKVPALSEYQKKRHKENLKRKALDTAWKIAIGILIGIISIWFRKN